MNSCVKSRVVKCFNAVAWWEGKNVMHSNISLEFFRIHIWFTLVTSATIALIANRIYVNDLKRGFVEHLADPDDVEVQKYLPSKVVDLSIPSILSCCSAIYEDNKSPTRRRYNLYIPNIIFEISARVNIAVFFCVRDLSNVFIITLFLLDSGCIVDRGRV